MEPIDIIINNFRRLHYLEFLIKAIEERTDFPYRIIVVDNCSIPKTKEFIKELKDNGRSIVSGAAAPGTGTWKVGDICWNTAPIANGAPGWVCTTAGTPGTWKSMANLAA